MEEGPLNSAEEIRPLMSVQHTAERASVSYMIFNHGGSISDPVPADDLPPLQGLSDPMQTSDPWRASSLPVSNQPAEQDVEETALQLWRAFSPSRQHAESPRRPRDRMPLQKN